MPSVADNPPAIIWTKTDSISDSTRNRILESPSHFGRMEAAWREQYASLAELRRLRDGWDGEGARAPSRELLDSLEYFLQLQHENESNPAPSRIVATADGTIAIEWHIPPVFSSLEIIKPYEGEWLIERPGYAAEFFIDRWSRRSTEQGQALVQPPSPSATWSLSGMRT
jgi:hypothetical protein